MTITINPSQLAEGDIGTHILQLDVSGSFANQVSRQLKVSVYSECTGTQLILPPLLGELVVIAGTQHSQPMTHVNDTVSLSHGD